MKIFSHKMEDLPDHYLEELNVVLDKQADLISELLCEHKSDIVISTWIRSCVELSLYIAKEVAKIKGEDEMKNYINSCLILFMKNMSVVTGYKFKACDLNEELQ